MFKAIYKWLVHGTIELNSRNCVKKPHGVLYATAINEQGVCLFKFSRTCLHPLRDWHVIETAITLEEAINDRGVDITPEVLYEHLVGRKYTGPVSQVGHEMILS